MICSLQIAKSSQDFKRRGLTSSTVSHLESVLFLVHFTTNNTSPTCRTNNV